MILASESPYSMDRILCDVVNLRPEEVETVAGAIRRGLCGADADAVELLGDPLLTYPDFLHPKSKSIGFEDKIPRIFRGTVKKLLVSRPVVRRKDCVGCGKCAESCPANAIWKKERKAWIDSSRCIRCFCCHEMCPVKAIDIRRFSLFRF